jgi:uncharacterized UPF0160 family protein
VWRHHGEAIAGSAAVAHVVEERLCQAIDAPDNGISLFTVTEHEIEPVLLFHVLNNFKPVWGSDEDVDHAFTQAVAFARDFLTRFIVRARGDQAMQAYIQTVYEQATDKRVLVFEKSISAHALIRYPEVHAVVYPTDTGEGEVWSANVLPKHYGTFENRASFPEHWAGLRGDDLVVASGIADVYFCHKGRFVCKARSREAAVEATNFLE